MFDALLVREVRRGRAWRFAGFWMPLRQWGAEAAKPVFDFAFEWMADGVVAIGLGGFEEQGPAAWYADLYREARERGLRPHLPRRETTGPQAVWGCARE